MKFLTALLITLNFLSITSLIAKPITMFKHFSVDDGFPDRTTWAIAEDKQRFIWFGTSKGLVRYDGYEFKTFSNKASNSQLMSNNVVRAIRIGRNDGIWVGTLFGLNRLDKKTEKFQSFQFPSEASSSIPTEVYSFESIDNEALLIGTNRGLFRLSYSSNAIVKLPIEIFEDNQRFRINDLLLTSKKKLLLGTTIGLFSISLSKLTNSLETNQVHKLNSYNVKSIIETTWNEIIFGTSKGTYQLKENKRLIDKYSEAIKEDSAKNIWIGTRDNGLFRISPDGNKKQFTYNKSSENSISDNDIYSLMFDKNGILWAGSFNGGVNYHDTLSEQFLLFDDSSNSLNCLRSPVIYSFFEDYKGNWWIGTQQGIAKIAAGSNLCELFRKEDEIGLLANEIGRIFGETNERILFSTYKGLNIWLKKENRFVKYESNLPEIHIKALIIDSHGNSWAATSFGLFVKGEKDENFKKAKGLTKIYDSPLVFSLLEVNNDLILIESWEGLLHINSQGIIAPVEFDSAIDLTQPIRLLHLDSQNTLWVGIDSYGLFNFDINGSLIAEYKEENTLHAINGFTSVLEDEQGILWISSTKGISSLNPQTGEIQNFKNSDGLQSNVFTKNSAYKSNDGNFYFGGRYGLNAFDPTKVKINKNTPSIVLTKFLYFNKVYEPSAENSEFTLPNNISYLEELNLSHRDYVFGFEFSALHYSAPKQNQYAYMMENWDEDWNYTNANFRRATYSNLPPGDYVFKVKASNNHGVWNETPRSVKINIAPAPWASPTAYVLYAVAFFLAILGFIKYRTTALEKRALELESTVNVRTKELATEKEKVEQLLSRKNEEFANVSHEFRTPLTLILGPINQLVTKSKDKNLVGKLNIVQRNALRLLRMVDQLLNLETFRVKAITQRSPQAIGKITQLVAEAFADLAEEKQITFNIGTIEPVCFDFTPDAFEKIILNLLSNAIKYTKPGGTITVCTTRIEQAQYQIQVSDTGIGIAKDKLEKVFERFNRVMDENSEQVTGSGIGLALVKSLVESHDGSVELESELGQGTTITVTLPIVNEVDESQINVHQNDEIIAMELMNVSSSGLHESSIAQSAETIQSTGKPTVLVIEDNDDMRQYIVESIGQQFNTLVAADGQAGLELAIQEVPDLIISDIMMPKLDGYQTTKALREAQITNHIPVVLLTARGDRDSRLKGWEEKADEYITKPFDVEELIIRISNLIEIRNILKRRFSETVFEQTEQAPDSYAQEMDSDSENLSIVEINTQKLQQEFINQLNQQIESVYMNAELGVIDLAKSVNMSERQFYRKLKSVIDMTPSEYLRRFRLEKSKEVLRSGKTANFTAFEVGFSSQAYFSKCFKAQYNLTPKQFINQK